MKNDKFDMLKFSTEVRALLESELDVRVGNMEAVSFCERLYKLVRARAYNQGLLEAKDLIERKLMLLTEDIEMLVQDE
jgi:uncharacterized protein (DUF2164 family)